MANKYLYSVLIICFILIAPWILADEEITIRIWLFQGTWMEGQEPLSQVEILSVSSRPEIATIKDKIDTSEKEFKSVVIEALLDAMDLQSVEDLFSAEKKLDARAPGWDETILRKQTVFRLNFAATRLSSQEVAFRASVFRSKASSLHAGKSPEEELRKALNISRNKNSMDKILDKELVLEMGNPIVIAIPYSDQVYFMTILLMNGVEGSKKGIRNETKEPEPAEIITVPDPIHQVIPAYPEELRQQGVEGKVGLRISIDQGGAVWDAKVVKPLHPYLDYAAVRAVRRWVFKPAFRKGKPIPVTFAMTVTFDPETYRLSDEKYKDKQGQPSDLEPSSQLQLMRILDQCADYCRKLADFALDFICEETINEVHYSFGEGNLYGGIGSGVTQGNRKPLDPENEWNVLRPRPVVTEFKPVAVMPLFDSGKTEKKKYTCDYQFVKKGDKIIERRIILKENGRKMADRRKLLEETRFGILMPLFASVSLLERTRQPLFNYALLEGDKIKGKKAYVLEVVPKSENLGDIESARIWVDEKSFQILQSEIRGTPLVGYDDILEDSTRYNINPVFIRTYQFQFEKKGLLFPSHAEIRVTYLPFGYPQTKTTKQKIILNYEKYRFFTVETEHKIIK